MWRSATGLAIRWRLPHSLSSSLLAGLLATSVYAQATKPAPDASKKWTTKEICAQIAQSADQWNISRTFFARLIWKESRFDIKAVSPVGAQGIAQFMPATAKARGLKDPYDPAQAIPASASLLAFHRGQFGNLGLAAAAYNAGPDRVRRWLNGKSTLPFETRDYVAAITGKVAANFRHRSARVNAPKLHKTKPFPEACIALPIMKTRFREATAAVRTPWGVQVAGNFSRAKAMRMWTRARAKIGVRLGNARPSLYRERNRPGMRPKWAVRLGAQTKNEAIGLCKRIRRTGSFCLVRRNR